MPPLVTTATGGGSGILGAADTADSSFGSDLVDSERRDGGRFTLGAWLDDEHCRARRGEFLSLGGFDRRHLTTQSLARRLLARPFFNVQLQTNAVQTIAAAGVSTGGVFIATASEVHGAELVLRRRIGQCCDRRVDFLYRLSLCRTG